MDDRKWAFALLEGRNFGDVPVSLEYKIEVWDALGRKVGGPNLSASSYFMKSPPIQHHDDQAHELIEAFIAGDIER